jgi:hypothetical protein
MNQNSALDSIDPQDPSDLGEYEQMINEGRLDESEAAALEQLGIPPEWTSHL